MPNRLTGPDFLDSVADQNDAQGLPVNAAEFRQRATEWRADQARIEQLCATRPRSNDELAKKIGTTRESIQVLTHRMRRYGQIKTLNAGTHQARHVARKP